MAAEAAISSLVQLLGQLLIQKVNFLRGVERKVKLLQDELNRMQSFLRDANKKLAKEETVRTWISQVRELALDAEDTIEMFLLNVENPRRGRGLLETYVCFPRHMYHLDRVGEEIESIRTRLDAIDKGRERYGIRDLDEAADSEWRSQVEARRRLAPWEKEEPVGVEEDVKKLLEFILDEEKKGLSTTAVVGMGGIGKSTLARQVYNHPHAGGGRFDHRAWVVVSSEFTPQETTKQVILELCRSDQEKQDVRKEIKELEEYTKDRLYLRRELKKLLNKQLEGKNYFIIVDDVWEMEHWELLRTVFPQGEDAISRLLITTRNNGIAKHCKNMHEVKFLGPEQSWELFLKKALTGKSHGDFPKELEPIGKNIVEKCKGLPLAISVMGGLLVDTQSKSEWEEALNEINSHLASAESNVSTILELSYLNLNPQLKSSFLCLAFFKEDAAIPVERLAQIMVGQGFIQQTDPAGRRRRVEDIARRFLNDLINRNLVQVHEFTFDNRVKTCHLHDSLREICLRKAKEEIGFEILRGEETRTTSLHKPRRRVSYYDHLHSSSMNPNKHIRSLFILNVRADLEAEPAYWKSFQHLKTVNLHGYRLLKLPKSFRSLLGLKQLRISKYPDSDKVGPRIPKLLDFFDTNISSDLCKPLKLPRWLDELKKLELLDLRDMYVEFPNVELKMNSLRHIHAIILGGPKSIRSWGNIETLKSIKKKDWMRCNSSGVGKEKFSVRDLSLVLDPDDDSKDAIRSLGKMANLVKLQLEWDSTIKTANDLPLHLGFDNLTKLKLRGMMRNCPIKSYLPPNLSHLTLSVSRLNDDEDPIQELGKLPKLLYLKLKRDVSIMEDLECLKTLRMRVLHDGFPCLEALSLHHMYNLSAIDVERGGMPCLKTLRIRDCPCMETQSIPPHIIILAS